MSSAKTRWRLARSVSLDGEPGGRGAAADERTSFEVKLSPRQKVLLKSAASSFGSSQYEVSAGQSGIFGRKSFHKVRSSTYLNRQSGGDRVSGSVPPGVPRLPPGGTAGLSLNSYGVLQAPGRALAMSRSADNEDSGSQLMPQQPSGAPSSVSSSPRRLLQPSSISEDSALVSPKSSPVSSPRALEAAPADSRLHPKLRNMKVPANGSKSLDEKLLAYQATRQKLDHLAAATGVRRDTQSDAATIVVGERCEVFSPEANDYVFGDVIQVKDEQVRVRYSVATDKKKAAPKATARWVHQGSSEFRRAGTVTEASSSFVREKSASFRRLTALEKQRAFQVLLREPEERTAETVEGLVAWTYSSDLFYGLSEKERRRICIDAEGEETAEDEALINVGEIEVRIHVVLKGRCAIYTMRGHKPAQNKSKSPTQSDQEATDIDLREKYQSMQRRASIAVRSDSTAGGAAPVVINDRGQAVLTPAVSASQRRRSIAIAMAPVVANRFKPSLEQQLEEPAPDALEMGVPVQLEYIEGDALGVEGTFHNVYPDVVEREGWHESTHTVTALTNLSCMVIKNPEHIKRLHSAQQANLKEKIGMLKTVSNYATHPEDCIEEMARHCRRVWFKPGDRIMKEGDAADSVMYIVSGQCRVVKDLGRPGERAMNVLGRGVCVGDWGVVNRQRRMASCVAVGEVQVLVIAAFNFEATATASLLSQLSADATEASACDAAESGTGGNVRANAVAAAATTTTTKEGGELGQAQRGPGNEPAGFQLITRRDKRNAAARLRAGETVA
jgi:hypothetical protein